MIPSTCIQERLTPVKCDDVRRDEIAARLKEARKQRRFDGATALHREMGAAGYRFSKSSVGEYERGESAPPADYIAAFCRLLRISPEWLLWNEGPMEYLGEKASDNLFAVCAEVARSNLPIEVLGDRLASALHLLREPEGGDKDSGNGRESE